MNKFGIPMILMCSLFLILSCETKGTGPEKESENEGPWRIVWRDEFDQSSLDLSKWNYETGGHGWGNNELQYYTDRTLNTYIQNGILIIEARRENYEQSLYTSARLTTKNKGDWLHGRFEIRAMLPRGQGIWPAIWMLPTDWEYGGWAASGEIDIMELVGHDTETVHGTIHYGGEYPQNVQSGTSYHKASEPDFSSGFHVFSVEWEPGELRWYVDDEHFLTKTEWYSTAGDFPAPFDKRFHLLMNIAVGGNWPGYPDATTGFPQKMYIDYVRVYEHTGVEE